MITVAVWKRGEGRIPPADLASGRYLLNFVGNWTAISAAHAAVGVILNRRLPFVGGHSIRPLSSTPVRMSNQTGLLQLEVALEGFSWALLLVVIGVIGGGLFAFLSLTEVRRIVVPAGPVGSILLLAAGVGAVAVIAYLVFSKRKK